MVVHLDRLAWPPQADDAVARHGVAAFGQREGDARRQARDRHSMGLLLALARACRTFLDAARHQRVQHLVVGDAARRDRDHQRRFVLQLEALDGGLLGLVSDLDRQSGDDLGVELLAERDHFAALLLADEATDRGPRLAGDGEGEPAGLRLLRVGFQDLDLVAIFEQRTQWHDAAVDLGADRLVAELGVHRIGEVDWGRSLGQLVQHALGGEGEDAVLVHRHAGVLEELVRVVTLFEDFDEIAQPSGLPVGARAFLVGPVRGEAELAVAMHPLRSYLDLDARIFLMDHGCLQRAIAVALGRRDIVLEPARTIL